MLQGAPGQASETASINSLGFRGPEFQATKPKDVLRVICLGESSTFGYHNSDTGTYPFLLQKLFQQNSGSLKVEVINAGFPYYNTGSILSLLKKELLRYKPDLLTVYSAHNDAGWPLEVSALRRALLWIQQHSMIYVFLKENILTDRLIYRVQRTKVFRKIAWLSFDPAAFENYLAQTLFRYRKNIKEIVAIAKREGIPIILIKQPMTTDNGRYSSVSYEQEYEDVLNRFHSKKGRLRPVEFTLIQQRRLNKELESIAKEENVPLVDNIAIVDRDRHRLATWVHLTEEGNLRLAQALKPVIEPHVFQRLVPRRF